MPVNVHLGQLLVRSVCVATVEGELRSRYFRLIRYPTVLILFVGFSEDP